MSAAIPLRADYDAAGVRAAASDRKMGLRRGGCWYWRRFTTARARGGGGEDWRRRRCRSSATGWCGSTRMGPTGLIDRKPPGPPPRLNVAQRQALAAMVESGPIPAVHGVVRWRMSISRSGSSRNFASPSARRRSAVNCAPWATANSRRGRAIMPRPPARLRDFKKASRRVWRRSRVRRASGRPI